MGSQWFVYVCIVGIVLALCASALDGALRQRALPTRWIWLGALGGFLFLAALAGLTRDEDRSVGLAPTHGGVLVVASAGTPAPRPSSLMLRIARAERMAASTMIASQVMLAARVPPGMSKAFPVAWLVATSVLLSLIVIVHLRAAEAKKAWPVARLHGTPVRVAPAVGPAVIGLSAPEIVIPEWILRYRREDQKIVIAHEREHMIEHDQVALVAGWLIAAFIPWHPAIWWMLSRLRLAIELDCDARVLERADVRARSYGTLLIDIAGHCSPFRLGALALADGPSHLERRLLAMRPIPTRYVNVRTALFGGLAVVALVVACESRMPTSAEIEKMDVAALTQSAAYRTMFSADSSRVRIFVYDGTAISEAAARAIPTAEIGQIQIVKGDSSNVVSIFSRGFYDQLKKGGVTLSKAKTKQADGSAHVEVARIPESDKTPVDMNDFRGILVIDNEEQPASRLRGLEPSKVAAVEVIKGSVAALSSSDPRAAQGIIRVTTKK